jgi:hypothetical protein
MSDLEPGPHKKDQTADENSDYQKKRESGFKTSLYSAFYLLTFKGA